MLIDAALRPRRQRRAAHQLRTSGAIATTAASPARSPAVWAAAAALLLLRLGEWALTALAHAGADAHHAHRPIGGYLAAVVAVSIATAAAFIVVVHVILGVIRPPIRYRTRLVDASQLTVGDLIEIDEPLTASRRPTLHSRIVHVQEIIPWTDGSYIVLSDHTTLAAQPLDRIAVADIHPADRWNLRL